jgi:catechol 2,3-dioxygenase-like lactoylglutathione lyase family enzyme
VAVDVRDVAAAQRWYSESLGFRYSTTEVEESSLGMGYSPKEVVIYLTEVSGNDRPDTRPGHPPIMFTGKLADAHKYLSNRGVNIAPIQSDSGGNQFFRFQDSEGNELEVCQEH